MISTNLQLLNEPIFSRVTEQVFDRAVQVATTIPLIAASLTAARGAMAAVGLRERILHLIPGVISALLIKATLEQLSSSDPSSSPAIEDSIAMPSSQTLIDCSLVAGTMVLGINYLRAGWRIFRQADNGWNRLSGIQPLVLGLSFLKSRPKIRLNPDFLEGAVCAQLVSQKIYQERRCFAPWNQKKNPDQCSLDQEFTPNRFPRQSNTTPCCNMSYREWKIPQLHCMTDKMMENHWLYSKMPSLAKKILFTYPSY